MRTKLGFSLVEVLCTLVIICITAVSYTQIEHLKKYYYYHRSKSVIKKINNIITFAKIHSTISNHEIILCPYDYKKQSCSHNWHNEIILFYATNNYNLSYFAIDNKSIIYKINNLISHNETIKLKQFSNKNFIIFNNNTPLKNPNGTIHYSNLYYTIKTSINKTARIKTDS